MRKLLLTATIFYALFLLAPNYRHYPAEGLNDYLLITGHGLLSSLGLFAFLFILILNKYVWSLLLPLLSMAAGLTAFFVWQIDISVNPALIESIFNTHAGEALDYLSWPLALIALLHLLVALGFSYWRWHTNWRGRDNLYFLAAAVMAATVFNIVNNKRVNTLSSRAPFVYYSAIKEQLQNKADSRLPRKAPGQLLHCGEDSLTVVLIIGEALRADHLQMNGYDRVTMPLMEARDVISFPNIYSPHTHTAASLPYMLTRAQPKLSDPMQDEHSLVQLFQKCGFRSTWLANQNPISTFSFIINECDSSIINKPHLSDYSNTPKYDSDLLPHFKRLNAEGHANQLIIVHIAGNHWWYNKNLPPDFHYYQPVMENKRLSPANRQKMINSYDNVTRFTDYVIDQMLQQLDEKNAWMIFLADHGQSFGEDGKWLHANDAPQEQNPASFAWFSDKYIKSHSEKVAQLTKNRLDTTDTAFLFHTLLQGSGIKTDRYEEQWDLFVP